MRLVSLQCLRQTACMGGRLHLVIICLSVLSACTAATLKKSDIRTDHPGESFTKNANYIALARYWDDNAEKKTGMPLSASLSIIQDEGRAEITLGNGPYYGLIDLKKVTDRSTRVTAYAWGSLANLIHEWCQLIRNAPE
jgi:hypothetical protein